MGRCSGEGSSGEIGKYGVEGGVGVVCGEYGFVVGCFGVCGVGETSPCGEEDGREDPDLDGKSRL